MAVAEKPASEIVARNPQQQLAISSLLGALLLLFSVGMVLSGLPTLWRESHFTASLNEFLADALMLVVEVPLIIGLIFANRYYFGEHPQRGMRAGSVFGAVALFLSVLLSCLVLNLLHPQNMGTSIEVGVTLVVFGALVFGIYWLLSRPGFGAFLGRLEDNGWFDMTAFKGNQGVRVRRGTVIGIIVIVACGLYVLVTHKSIGSENWEIPLPFLGDRVLPILYVPHIVIPLLIAVVALWLAWRIVNWPPFADFLIATEAEMNKVSWTTRKRLVQDTIVVLVTVFLFTVFLFVVDILWVYLLSNQYVKVLLVDPGAERAKQNAPTAW